MHVYWTPTTEGYKFFSFQYRLQDKKEMRLSVERFTPLLKNTHILKKARWTLGCTDLYESMNTNLISSKQRPRIGRSITFLGAIARLTIRPLISGVQYKIPFLFVSSSEVANFLVKMFHLKKSSASSPPNRI